MNIKTHLVQMLREVDARAWQDSREGKRDPTDPFLGLEGEAANEIERMHTRFIQAGMPTEPPKSPEVNKPSKKNSSKKK